MKPNRARPKAKLVVLRPGTLPDSAAKSSRRVRQSRGSEAAHRNGSAPPDLLIVHNPGSTRFTPEAVIAAARTVLDARGLTHRMVSMTGGRDAASAMRRQIARAIREGCSRIAAAGGDGTVSMVAQYLVRRGSGAAPVSLGIIPAGTTNVLARELGIPLGLEEAMAVIADADRAVELDAILVGRRYVLTQVGIGPDALMIRNTRREQQKKLGRWAYAITFARLAFRFRPRWFTLRLDGTVVRARAWLIVAANVGTVAAPPFTWGPRIDPTDGTLDLCVFNVNSRRDIGKLIWRALTSRHRRDENARFYRVREHVVVESSQPTLVQGDGEVIGTTPVTMRVVPAALRVLVARAVEGAVVAPPASEGATPASKLEVAATPAATKETPEVDARETEPGGLHGSREPTSGSSTPSSEAPPKEGAEGADAAPSVGENVERMIGERSRTWPLQGLFRHPLAALEAYDAAIFLRLNAVSLGGVFDRTLELLSRFIHYGEGWAVVVLFLLLVDLRRGLEAAVVALPALWATMLTVNIVLKRVFRRRRPFLSFVDARVIGPRPRDYSFPSGHSAAGFAGAVLLGMFVPRWAPLFYLFALAVGFSRIYLGVHYPSDVLMGALSGSVLAVTYRAIIHLLLAGGA